MVGVLDRVAEVHMPDTSRVQYRIVKQLAQARVDNRKQVAILTFEMMDPTLPRKSMVITKDGALGLAKDLLRLLSPKATVASEASLCQGFPTQRFQAGWTHDDGVYLNLFLAPDAPITFALSRDLAKKLGAQLVSIATTTAPKPPPLERAN
jgi:hypothetical protein